VRSCPRVAVLFFAAVFSAAQEPDAKKPGNERMFPQPVAIVQAALQGLPGGTSGRLPVLDGFVVPGPHPLSRYQRPYYQCDVRVMSAKSGGSLVKATAKITAWFSGPGPSGYQRLESNGRVESDLLDRLEEALAASSSSKTVHAVKVSDSPPAAKSAGPEINAPLPQLPDRPALSVGIGKDQTNPQDKELKQEAKSLEEILRNQSHPANLIAVKQDNTPVLQNPMADAKVLFLASAEDEFEVLDENPGWVHVRISGLSRGWLRRSAVEMLGESQARASNDSVAVKTDKPAETDHAQSLPTFSVSSEEVGSFPGEWLPLRGKNVKIISLQQAPATGRITSPQDKKQFAEALFKKESPGLSAGAAGLVLIFDAEDGGMVATTRAALEQWNRGTLSDQAFWKQCFLDPPEILGAN
jgi:hypothetical protein